MTQSTVRLEQESVRPDRLPRPHLLGQLRSALETSARVVVVDEKPTAFGFGKTELASAYIQEFGSGYENVFWIRSVRPSVLKADFAELALTLDLSDASDHCGTTMTKVVAERLKHTNSWLLVADAVCDIDVFRRLFEDIPTGHLIVTGRSHDYPPPFERVYVPGFNGTEVEQYFGDSAGELSRLNGYSAALSFLQVPLVSRLVAAFRSQLGVSISEMAGMLVAEPSNVTADERTVRPGISLAPLVQRALTLLRSQDASVFQLALTCAHLDSDSISPALLANESAFLPSELSEEVSRAEGRVSVFRRLAGFGLIRVRGESATMHPSIQRAILSQLEDRDRQEWSRRMLRLALDAFPYEDPYQGYLAPCSRRLGVALGAADRCLEIDCELESAGMLLNRVGQYLHGFGDHESATDCLERSARIAARLEGYQSPTLALRLNNLGAAELAAGEHESARTQFMRALEIVKTQEDSHRALMSEVLRNLANTHLMCDDLEAARVWLKEALGRHLHFYGRNHVYVAECLNQLGVVFAKSGQSAQALKSFQHAVSVGRTACGSDRLLLASCLSNLGDALRKQGEFEQAEACMVEALNLYEVADKENHRRIAGLLVRIGRIMRRRKNFAGAAESFERAYTLSRESNSETMPALLAWQLGRTYALDGNSRAALEWHRHSLALHEAQQDTTPAKMIEMLVDTGELALKQGDEQEGESLLQRALVLHENGAACADRHLARIVSGIGQAEERRGNFETSVQHYDRARLLSLKEYGDGHPAVAREMLNIGRCLYRLGRGFEAVANVAHAERIFSEQCGPNHSDTRRAHELLDQLRG